MRDNPAVQGAWRMKSRQAPDLERSACSMKTIDRMTIIGGMVVTALYCAFLLAILLLSPDSRSYVITHSDGTIELRRRCAFVIWQLLPILVMFGSPVAFVIILTSIWRLIRTWTTVPLRIPILIALITGTLLTGFAMFVFVVLTRIGPINPG